MTRNAFILLFAILLLASCASVPATAPSAPPMWAGLTPGEFAAGFRTTYLTTAPHPLQISVWYPAQARGYVMHYRDYLVLSLGEKTAKAPTEAERKAGLADLTKFLTGAGLADKTAHTMIEAKMFAHRDAPAIDRKFPLVFIVQGNGQTASAQAVLAEFIASHGYVVASIPSITRVSTPMTSAEQIGPKSVEQAEDIDRAVTAIAASPNVAQGPIAVIGHSFGARGALIYAMHHPVSALISLDGGIGTPAGTQSMLNEKAMDLTASMPPVLHFYEMLDDRMTPDFRLLRSLRTPNLDLVRRESMQHTHFTTDGFAATMLPEFAKITKAGPDLQKELVDTAQQTLAFIEKTAPRG
jgi:dienelactone hydrolase